MHKNDIIVWTSRHKNDIYYLDIRRNLFLFCLFSWWHTTPLKFISGSATVLDTADVCSKQKAAAYDVPLDVPKEHTVGGHVSCTQ